MLVTVLPAGCGDAGGPSDVDDQPPAVPDLGRIEVVPPVPDGIARLVGSSGAVEGSSEVRVVNLDATSRNGGTLVEARTNAAADGSFSTEVSAELGDDLVLTAIDDAGNESQSATTSSGPVPEDFTEQGIGQVQLFPFADAGAVTLPFETGQERYVVIAQSLNPSGDSFEVKMTGALGTRIGERKLGAAAAATHASPDAWIRALERRVLPLLATSPPVRARALAAAQQLGDERDFFVVNRTGEIDINNQNHFDEVTATLRFIDQHTEIYVDNRVPAQDVPSMVTEQIGRTFDDEIYLTDRNAFGEESDVDGNERVIILLTPTVNALNTEETVEEGLVVLGFFFGVDLGPVSAFPFSNEAEIFYAVVPDPTGEFSPAEIPLDGIEDLLSSIFAHEFVHMISANQHILIRSGQPEEIWLDEGLAHFAETLTGFPLQNRFRSALFLDEPQTTSLVGGDDSLERRGVAWLFVQYLVDRFGEEILGQLVQTRFTGITNVERVTDRSMMFLFHEFASALFLDGISDDPFFHIPSLDLRAEFLLAKQQLTREIGDYLGIVDRALGGLASAATIARDVDGLAAAYYEVGSSSAGSKPIVLSSAPGANLQTAVFRIE